MFKALSCFYKKHVGEGIEGFSYSDFSRDPSRTWSTPFPSAGPLPFPYLRYWRISRPFCFLQRYFQGPKSVEIWGSFLEKFRYKKLEVQKDWKRTYNSNLGELSPSRQRRQWSQYPRPLEGKNMKKNAYLSAARCWNQVENFWPHVSSFWKTGLNVWQLNARSLDLHCIGFAEQSRFNWSSEQMDVWLRTASLIRIIHSWQNFWNHRTQTDYVWFSVPGMKPPWEGTF